MTRALFFCIVLRKFLEIKITNNKLIFSQCNIFISFFDPRFDLFSIIAKKVNQIRNNVVCVVARLVFVFCCALTTDCCNAFQHIFVKVKEVGVLQPIFPDYIISCDYAVLETLNEVTRIAWFSVQVLHFKN